MSLTLTEAKTHVRGCIERNDVQGLQKLLENPEPFLSLESMKNLVTKMTNDWPKLQAEAAKQREWERQRKLDEPRERELEKFYATKNQLCLKPTNQSRSN